MNIEVNENREIVLKEAYSGVLLETQDGEYMGICMRDTGFEFNYNGVQYEAKNGIVKKMVCPSNNINSDVQCCDGGKA